MRLDLYTWKAGELAKEIAPSFHRLSPAFYIAPRQCSCQGTRQSMPSGCAQSFGQLQPRATSRGYRPRELVTTHHTGLICTCAHDLGRVPSRRRGEVPRRVLVEGPARAIGAVARRVRTHGGRAPVLQPLVSELLPPLPRRRLAVLRSRRAAEEVGELVGACMVQDTVAMCAGLQEAAPLNTKSSELIIAQVKANRSGKPMAGRGRSLGWGGPAPLGRAGLWALRPPVCAGSVYLA